MNDFFYRLRALLALDEINSTSNAPPGYEIRHEYGAAPSG